MGFATDEKTPDLYLATPCDRRCIAWFPSVSAIGSADPENPTVEPSMKWIGRPLAEIWPFEFSQM